MISIGERVIPAPSPHRVFSQYAADGTDEGAPGRRRRPAGFNATILTPARTSFLWFKRARALSLTYSHNLRFLVRTAGLFVASVRGEESALPPPSMFVSRLQRRHHMVMARPTGLAPALQGFAKTWLHRPS